MTWIFHLRLENFRLQWGDGSIEVYVEHVICRIAKFFVYFHRFGFIIGDQRASGLL